MTVEYRVGLDCARTSQAKGGTALAIDMNRGWVDLAEGHEFRVGDDVTSEGLWYRVVEATARGMRIEPKPLVDAQKATCPRVGEVWLNRSGTPVTILEEFTTIGGEPAVTYQKPNGRKFPCRLSEWHEHFVRAAPASTTVIEPMTVEIGSRWRHVRDGYHVTVEAGRDGYEMVLRNEDGPFRGQLCGIAQRAHFLEAFAPAPRADVKPPQPAPPAPLPPVTAPLVPPGHRCPRCAAPAYVGLRDVVCEREGGCRTESERIGEPCVSSYGAVNGERVWTAVSAPGGERIHSGPWPTREMAVAAWRERALAAERDS